jgi:putative membrane protein
MLIPSFIRGVGFENFYAALITAVVLGVLNALIRPVLLLLTLPINFLTLGLFTLVINGLLFWLTSTVVKGFFVEGFWPAFWAALIFSIFSFIVSWIDKKIEAKV